MAGADSIQNDVAIPVTRRTNCESHGESRTKLYGVWKMMKHRCNNLNYYQYRHYGGRGISVCQQWNDSFVAFRAWAISHGYQDGLEIDRRDNDGNYCPENCRFATSSQNKMNRRVLKVVSSKYRGVSWDSRCKAWYATIKTNRRQKNLGRFKAQLAAALAYDNAAHDLHGEFASLNFPERKRRS